MIILNLGMVIGLVAIGASRLHKMKHEVSREDEKDEKLTKRRASADNSGYPAGYGDGDCNIGRQCVYSRWEVIEMMVALATCQGFSRDINIKQLDNTNFRMSSTTSQ